MTKAKAPANNNSLTGKLWFHILLVFLICVVLYGSFFFSLSRITHHGSEVRVPSVAGMDIKAAVLELKAQGFDVFVDSAYRLEQKPFTVLAQQPEANAIVKFGRSLFITVNKAEPPATAMPNLLGLSFRSASMILKSNKLFLGDTTYRPDIADGAILEQLYKGEKIRPGQVLPQGSRIDLVIGDGLGETEMDVPDLIGKNFIEAMAEIGAKGLIPNPIYDGQVGPEDTAMLTVYDQQPKSITELGTNSKIHQGDIIDIFAKMNPTPEELERNRNATAPLKGADSISK